MKSLNVSKMTKLYVVLSIVIILVVVSINFIVKNTLYSIESKNTSNFLVKVVSSDDDKEKEVGKLFSLYVIPNSTTSLRIETKVDENLPNEGIIKPLASADLGLGIRKIELNFTHQYDIAMNGVESSGCTHGKHPNMLSYSCTNLNKVVQYDASSLTGKGSYISTPPTPVEAFSSYYKNIPERTIGLQKYKDGLLLLTANQSEKGYPLHDSARLEYIDQYGKVSDIELVEPLGEITNSRYQLITDSSGNDSFGLIDSENNQVIIYSSPNEKPLAVELRAEQDLNINSICSLNNTVLACYTGVMNLHTHSDEEEKSIEQLGAGKLVVYDSKNKNKLADLSVPKNNPISNICIDARGHLYSINDNYIEFIDYSEESLSRKSIIPNANSMSCGNKTHFTVDGSVYVIENEGEAHLIYTSKSLPATNVDAFADSAIIQASFKSKPGVIYSFSTSAKDKSFTTMRTSDIVSRVIDKYPRVDFIVNFSPDSIKYIMRSYAMEGGGIDKDESSMNLLINETKKFNSAVKPEAHFLPPSSSSAL